MCVCVWSVVHIVSLTYLKKKALPSLPSAHSQLRFILVSYLTETYDLYSRKNNIIVNIRMDQ